jgi:hypothetical protein
LASVAVMEPTHERQGDDFALVGWFHLCMANCYFLCSEALQLHLFEAWLKINGRRRGVRRFSTLAFWRKSGLLSTANYRKAFKCNDLEARVGIERGSFTVPSLTHSVSRLILTLFYRGSSYFFDYLFNATHCPVTASKLPVR